MSQAFYQLLDKSACLTKAQLLQYTEGRLIEEELYAVETHLNSCVMCSAAADGMQQFQPEAVAVMAELDGSFLKKYFEETQPQIHLNSVAPAIPLRNRRKKEQVFRFPIRSFARLTAAGLAALGIFWLLHKVADAPRPQQQPGPASVQAQAATAPATEEAGMLNAITAPTSNPNATLTSAATSPAPLPSDPGSMTPATSTAALMATKTADTSAPAQQTASAAPAHQAADAVEAQPALPVAALPEATPPITVSKQTKDPEPAIKETTKSPKEIAGPATGSAQPQRQQFQHTIKTFRKDLDDPDQEKRNLARLMSAQAYQGMGEPDKAIPLLEQIMEEGGPHKGEARRTLRKIRRSR